MLILGIALFGGISGGIGLFLSWYDSKLYNTQMLYDEAMARANYEQARADRMETALEFLLNVDNVYKKISNDTINKRSS